MELKFRAWHKKYKGYYEIDAIYFYDKTVSYILNDYVNQEQSLEYFDFDEVIIEQYTGLKDKNGKEIYVGDIIEMPFSGTNFKIEYRKFEDVGCNGGEYSFYITGFMPVRMDGTVDSWGTCEIAYSTLVEEDVEVVGNIHEREEN